MITFVPPIVNTQPRLLRFLLLLLFLGCPRQEMTFQHCFLTDGVAACEPPPKNSSDYNRCTAK